MNVSNSATGPNKNPSIPNAPIQKLSPEEEKKKFEKTKKEIDKIKDFSVKKFKYILAMRLRRLLKFGRRF
jgi:hypothetical protein